MQHLLFTAILYLSRPVGTGVIMQSWDTNAWGRQADLTKQMCLVQTPLDRLTTQLQVCPASLEPGAHSQVHPCAHLTREERASL